MDHNVDQWKNLHFILEKPTRMIPVSWPTAEAHKDFKWQENCGSERNVVYLLLVWHRKNITLDFIFILFRFRIMKSSPLNTIKRELFQWTTLVSGQLWTGGYKGLENGSQNMESIFLLTLVHKTLHYGSMVSVNWIFNKSFLWDFSFIHTPNVFIIILN